MLQDWPQHGRIEIKDATMRYRPNTPNVLKGLFCTIEPQEHIGIVGRTGSGKSSLALTLFRLIELSRGKILIDNIDISTVGLRKLRRSLVLVP